MSLPAIDPISLMGLMPGSKMDMNFMADGMDPVGSALGKSLQAGHSEGNKFSFKLPDINEPQAPSAPGKINVTEDQPSSFGHLAQQMVRNVNDYQTVAGEKVRDVLMGGKTSVHEAMISVQESSVAFQMLAEMRNKVLESYQELNRMQI